MKKVTSNEIKVGDFIRTETIYDIFEGNLLYGRHIVAKIIKIYEGEHDKKRTIKYKGWSVLDNTRITKGCAFSKSDVNNLYLMDEHEVNKFNKLLILENLK